MEILGQVLVLVHLLGFGSLFGGLVVQTRQPAPDVNGAMLHGAWVALLTGAGLVALLVTGPDRVPYAPLAVKSVLTLFLVLLVSVNRRYASIPKGLWRLLVVLTLILAGVSVLWQ